MNLLIIYLSLILSGSGKQTVLKHWDIGSDKSYLYASRKVKSLVHCDCFYNKDTVKFHNSVKLCVRYEFDSSGKIYTSSTLSDTPLTKIYFYGTSGKLDSVTNFDAGGKVLIKQTYEYDSLNRIVKQKSFNNAGTTTTERQYLSRYSYVRSVSHVKDTAEFTNAPFKHNMYQDTMIEDERGLLVEHHLPKSKKIYHYDKAENLVYIEEWNDKKVYHKIAYQYNRYNGEKVNYKKSNGTQSTVWLELTFDEQGNWVTKSTIEKDTGQRFLLSTRQFSYY